LTQGRPAFDASLLIVLNDTSLHMNLIHKTAFDFHATFAGVKTLACRRCLSDNLREFSAEINVHFRGWEGLEKPTVWLWPEIVVCLDCGIAEFLVPEVELPNLQGCNSEATSPPHHE